MWFNQHHTEHWRPLPARTKHSWHSTASQQQSQQRANGWWWFRENGEVIPPPPSNILRVRDSLWECSQRGTSNTPKCFFRCLHCQMCVLFFFLFFFPSACPPVCLLTLWCARAALSGSSHRHAGCRSKSGKLQMDLIRSRGKSKRCDPKVPPPLQKKDLCHPESRALTDEVNVKVSEATEMNIKAHPLQNSNLYY